MRDAPRRLVCPACLGVALKRVPVAPSVAVSHCGRCGGTWLPRMQIPRLREVPARALRTMFKRRDDAGFACHGCHGPMERDAATCTACGWRNTLECPDCVKPMRRETRNGVTVDVCRPCKAVWLDHHELSAVWAAAATVAVAARQGGSSAVADAGEFLLDLLLHAPDLAVHAAGGLVEAGGAGLELVGNLGSAGLNAISDASGSFSSFAEGLGALAEVAGSVFGLIAEILGGLFDGL
jgi:Zn-finger nucleic acid-binding protein